MKTIFRTIESNTSRYLDFLCDICAFEATAYDKETLDMMANYIAIFAKDEEFWVERVSFEKCGDFLCIDINKGAEKGCVLLAHTGTPQQK